jgi:ABC-type antimicrobial peptide transport system permease subunit
VAAGIAIGLLLGFGSARVLQTLLFGVGAGDPLTFIGAPVLLMSVGALAALLPALRASRVDPANVLRAE